MDKPHIPPTTLPQFTINGLTYIMFPGEDGSSVTNKRRFERPMAAAAVNAVSSTNLTSPEI